MKSIGMVETRTTPKCKPVQDFFCFENKGLAYGGSLHSGGYQACLVSTTYLTPKDTIRELAQGIGNRIGH